MYDGSLELTRHMLPLLTFTIKPMIPKLLVVTEVAQNNFIFLRLLLM